MEALGGTLGGENTAGRQAGREGACSRSRRQGERQRRRERQEGQIGEVARQHLLSQQRLPKRNNHPHSNLL